MLLLSRVCHYTDVSLEAGIGLTFQNKKRHAAHLY